MALEKLHAYGNKRDQKLRELEFFYRDKLAHLVQSHLQPSLWFSVQGAVAEYNWIPPFDHSLRSDEWTAQLHKHRILACMGVYVDDLLIAGHCSLNDTVVEAVQNVWKTSQPEHLGPDPDCVPILRLLGMNLERVDAERSAELNLPVGSILLSQMEYIIEVLMKFEPSLQLKTRTTPGNQESFATGPTTAPPTEAEHAECLASLEAPVQEEIIELNALEKKNTKLHYNSEQDLINLPAIVGCLNWIALRTRPDIAWATSRAASLITHDPDTCFIRVKHINCQYLHHTLGYALRYVPIPRQSKHKLWVLGDASFAPTGEKSQQGLIVYHGITSNQKKGGNLVQWRSSRQDLIAKPTCEAELIASSEALRQGENIAIVVPEMTNKSCEIEVTSDNAASLHMIRNGSETAWRTRHISSKHFGCIKWPAELSSAEMAADSLTKALEPVDYCKLETIFVSSKTSMS